MRWNERLENFNNNRNVNIFFISIMATRDTVGVLHKEATTSTCGVGG
jgi:adenine C2-methylase RlmN of 23S rRNA A2503 and tRNA A37